MTTLLTGLAPEKSSDFPADDCLAGKDEVSTSASSVDVPSLGVAVEQDGRLRFWSRTRRDPDSIATQPSVFDDPATLEIYRPPPQYENAHRFDPNARWTVREENRVVRKIDSRIMLLAFVMFFSLDLDRSNISQANTDNFLNDLKMTTNDYNLGNTLFRLCFLIAELPSQLISKRVGPDVWIPSQMVLWSFVSMGQFWISGRASFLATRCLLGFMQGGFIPDVVLYLSYYYTRSELPVRLAFFWVSNYTAELVGAFIATGILRLRGVHGRAGWRYLFLIEGCFTLVVGLVSFYLMPPGPTQTKAWYRPKGWFTEREEVIMVNRVLRDDPSKSDMHNREGLSPKMIWGVMKEWRMWPLYLLGLTHMIPVEPPQFYLTLTLRHLGFSTTQTNLLTIPASALGILNLVGICYLSERMNSRAGATVIMQFWALPLLVALYTFSAHTSNWAYYAVMILLVGFPYVHPIQVAWASANSSGVGTRTVSASLYNMFVQACIIISANIYRDDDKPLYKRGNRALIGITSMNIVLYALTFLFYRTMNKRRDRTWNSWTPEQQQQYLDTTKDRGNQRMNFRFIY